MKMIPTILIALSILSVIVALQFWPPALWILTVLVPITVVYMCDVLQTSRAILRNYPVIGHFRYLFEMIRPEINQYFIESNLDGTPYNRELRSVAYQRAKKELDTVPFGTQRNVYELGYEWITHSLAATHPSGEPERVLIGDGVCEQPYPAALLNISGMSYGALSKNAVIALNGGAKLGGFCHNTGEGSISPHHLAPGGDLCWQIGTGYFGCRNEDGTFDRALYAERSRIDAVKMIEIKLSQGAKPGHGGILPAKKITQEISDIRNVPFGSDVVSPPSHSAFRNPFEMLEFINELRMLSGGKPVGFKICLGNPSEFLGLCMAMQQEQSFPDFITIDGGEGGTGAAPIEFSNSVGAPLTEGIVLIHNALVGFGIRQPVKLIVSGKILTGFDMAKRLAAGADLCNMARGFMFSLGCIQARRCNSNDCPVGVTTQQDKLVKGLVVKDKTTRVANFQQETVQAFRDILGAAGLERADDLTPWHIIRRISQTEVRSYAQIYKYLRPSQLLSDDVPDVYADWLSMASPERFENRNAYGKYSTSTLV